MCYWDRATVHPRSPTLCLQGNYHKIKVICVRVCGGESQICLPQKYTSTKATDSAGRQERLGVNSGKTVQRVVARTSITV